VESLVTENYFSEDMLHI